ncbi:MAG: cytochrome c peroxidase [Pirellulales bacterium]
MHWSNRLASGVAASARVLFFAAMALAAGPLRSQTNLPVIRRPAALALTEDDRWLLVANHRSGTVSVIDTVLEQVAAEHSLGRQISDVQLLPDGRLLALDEAAHQLLLLAMQGQEIQTLERLDVSPFPVSLSVSADGRTCFVASLWSRCLSKVAISMSTAEKNQPTLRVTETLRLPFAPREQLLAQEETKVLVADSFGGRLAVIDANRCQIESLRELPAHNIRGLSLDPSGKKVLVAHQITNGLAETSENDIHWGIVLINVVRWLSLENVLNPKAGILDDSHVHPAGDFHSAGGDPAGIAFAPDGTMLAALAGTNRLAWGRETDYSLQSIEVGMRPTQVIVTSDGQRAYVANTSDDSISVVDLPASGPPRTILLGAAREPDLVEQGERLFYDARLSLDGWFSCHSCHTDGHTSGQLVDNLGDDSYGAAKQVISLLGCGQTGPWAWNGQVEKLEHQVQNSIETTMQGQADNASVAALSEYLRGLAPPPPLGSFDKPGAETDVEDGKKLFTKLQCAACHNPQYRYTSDLAYDVGLADRLGNHHFNPPSLQGVSQRESFFHDNRAKSLADVLAQFGHGLKEDGLQDRDLNRLLAYLQSL